MLYRMSSSMGSGVPVHHGMPMRRSLSTKPSDMGGTAAVHLTGECLPATMPMSCSMSTATAATGIALEACDREGKCGYKRDCERLRSLLLFGTISKVAFFPFDPLLLPLFARALATTASR
jgi:hypothetical protein